MKRLKQIQNLFIFGLFSGIVTFCLPDKWDKTFPKSEKVEHKKVSFNNRYGIKLSADLYLPKDIGTNTLPALALSGPFGAVKEQVSGLYAQTMAERGFITLAFDPSYTGESGGEPRNLASPDINTEDFSAAIDYLGLLPTVDRNRIGIIGICGFAGMGLNAAAVDKRIKAIVTTSMYDMSRVMAKGLNDSLTKEGRSSLLESLSEQRYVDAKNGKPTPGPRNLPETLDGNTSPITDEFFQYYRTERGFHKNSPNSNGAWTTTTPLSFMNMPLLTYIKEISPRPILFIAGETAHSRYFSEDAFKQASEPKELMIIPNSNHVDLYDRIEKIPFDTITSFFQKHLK
ncbi:alpha/beta hydrolase [Leptospira mtsangambouensis]|uniref:alpha/beta hydrolase n=1 Tax=Leptospira mtsangambouensis TaxID=2484912 RepID=UPI001EEAD6C6|nr:alpha/beta hydrolase [Leptospira mtsangambouensis]MCG6139812.1 alpha/beta hydrolase [Leptospira mtsangambouensis]